MPPDGSRAPVPIVIFIPVGVVHATTYLAWIEHLVQRGAVVLFSLYQDAVTTEREYRQAVLHDVESGLETLLNEEVPIDLTLIAVVGHSVGGVLAVDYAASAAVPVPSAVMVVVTGCLTEAVACLGAGMHAVPAATRILLVTEADDFDPTVPRAVERIWVGLEGIPLENRDVVRLTTDAHGRPPLLATHGQAEANHDGTPPDAFAWYGTWKWLDALMGCSFAGEWCGVAIGNTPEQRFMGTWSDGVPVTEAVVSNDPASSINPALGW